MDTKKFEQLVEVLNSIAYTLKKTENEKVKTSLIDSARETTKEILDLLP